MNGQQEHGSTMNIKVVLSACLILVACVYQAKTTEPENRPRLGEPTITQEKEKEKEKLKPPDKEKKTPEKKLADPAETDIFAPAPPSSGEVPLGFHPHMLGDFPGSFARQTITIFGVQTTVTTSTTVTKPMFIVVNGENVLVPGKTITTTKSVTTPIAQTRTVLVPVGALGAFKIAENASPRPVDRVFFTYNFFGDLSGPGSGANNPINITTGNNNVRVNTFIPGTSAVNSNVNREIFGFEKTFLDGFASIEMRLPLLQQNSTLNGFGSNDIGDLTIIGKYAFILDQPTGNVLSAGLAITAPTGHNIATIDGNIHSTLIQPWVGYIWNYNRFFLQAFHSIVVPTDSRDVTLLFNDVGFNYWLYRGEPNRTLSSIVPMIEVHVTNPLNQRGPDSAIYVPDLVVMTGGVHFGFGRNTTLSFGVATPVTGPRIYNVEAFMQFNMRF
jgi:hypothetical protein